MRHKGFTLVEVIISITLLAIIGITIGVSLNKVNKNRTTNDEEIVTSKIKSAADVYLSSNTSKLNELNSNKAYVLITVKELKDEGLLQNDLIDPETGEKIADTSEVMASLDSTGTIKYDYPANPDKTEHLQALNVYLEENENVSCDIGKNSPSLALAMADGTLNNSFTINSNSCDAASIVKNNIPGTYKVTYTYTLTDGSTKTATRNFIVQDKVKVTLSAKTNNSSIIIKSGDWATEPYSITPSTDRAARVEYSWTLNGSSVTSNNGILSLNSNQKDKKYTLNYTVKNINNDVVAYVDTTDFVVNLELNSIINSLKPSVSGDTAWHSKDIVLNVDFNDSANQVISGIKDYKYCMALYGSTCIPDTAVTNKTITSNKIGQNKAYVVFTTNAGNTSGVGSNGAYFDNVSPICTSGSVSGTLSSNCNDNPNNTANYTYSGINSALTEYGYSTSTSTTPTSWSTSTSITSPGCGSTYAYFVRSHDYAGNVSEVKNIGTQSGGSCCYGCDCGGCYYDPPAPVCDAACQVVAVGNWWGANCSGCSQAQFDQAVSNAGGITVGGTTIGANGSSAYSGLQDIRNSGGYSSANNGACTVGVTCGMY